MVTGRTLGVAVATDVVCACRRKRDGQYAVATLVRAVDESIGDAVVRALLEVGSLRRASVAVVVMDERLRTGPLFASDPNIDDGAVQRALKADPSAYFLGARGSLVAGNVWREDSKRYGAVADSAFADELTHALSRAGASIVGLGATPPRLSPQEAARAALAVRPDGPGVVDIARSDRDEHARARRRKLALTATTFALAWALAAPLVGHQRTLARHEVRELRAIRERDSLSVALATADVRPELLLELARWVPERSRVRETLLTLVTALPDSTALITVRIDSESGALQLVAADAADAISRLAATEGLLTLKVVGAIASEGESDRRLERVSAIWVTTPDRAPVRRSF